LQTDEENIVICIPLLDDWESATVLIRQIDMVCAQLPVAAEVLLVDDGSTAIPPAELGKGTTSLKRIDILHLRRNLGHQRAIAIGLAYIQENRPCSAVVVMDGDGEDLPRDIPRLLDRLTSDRERSVVFAKRRRRAEGLLFRTLYQVFKVVHRILTGRKVEVGNFSVIPREQLGRLVAVSETWNHYAASVFKAKIPVEMVPTDRAPRIAGTSKMNLVGLVTHGLSAMSVFADTVGVRLLLATCPMALLAVAGLLAVVVIRLFTNLAIPGWTTIAACCLMIVLLQALVMSIVFVFVALHGRVNLTFLPIRDYRYFVRETQQVRTNV
jgi:hypothetical protein